MRQTAPWARASPAETIFSAPSDAYTRALMAAAFDLVADKTGAIDV